MSESTAQVICSDPSFLHCVTEFMLPLSVEFLQGVFVLYLRQVRRRTCRKPIELFKYNQCVTAE